jgi:hypothetical protein
MTILTKEQWKASVAETWSAAIKATYQHLIDEAVKAEREACAKLCDYVYDNIVTDEHIKDMAFKIRARGETK